MRALAPVLILAALVLVAGCGGEAETVTVTDTVTVTETVEADAEGARLLAEDLCRAVPPSLLRRLGADPDDPESTAREFAQLARPELREDAREGCRDGRTG